ncbi:PA0061/PA0062 family lipoprotein [Stutzerimonas tarimensis]|uniref:Lipoprotein n=1 Tax=Stutzerimonas tarimensis TaxID=1507735 RepID=A0ABV7T6X4_9GAMM
MRGLLPGLLILSLTGCATLLPPPRHDPAQAWIDLQTLQQDAAFEAAAVDHQALKDGRYFQVAPGGRRLDMNYRFVVSPANVGGDQGMERDCRLVLHYDRFDAGSRYRLVAGGRGFRPWAKLYDEQDFLIAQAEEKGCGSTLAGG